MANKRAQILDKEQLVRLLRLAETTDAVPESARLCILLSFKAGLRCAEITKLRVRDLLTASGQPSDYVHIFSGVGKGGKERQVPMHPQVRDALIAFRRVHPRADRVALGQRGRKRPYARSANAQTAWFYRLYKQAGFRGCSSHTGRRTFATMLTRNCHRFENNIVDVQKLLGHSRLSTTEAYIEMSDSVSDLVSSL